MHYIDIQKRSVSENIQDIFPGFSGAGECLAVFSPHDDDGIIGAGYAIRAALKNHASVYIYIFCRGNAGYSDPEKKDEIEATRELETTEAYVRIGVPAENIVRFNFSDFNAGSHIGWKDHGTFEPVIRMLRVHKVTRVLIPNGYREHEDHTAVNFVGAYDVPQAGDPIVVDWGTPQLVKSIMEYAVWADLSPEDALVHGRDCKLRANRLILVPTEEEQVIAEGIRAYVSQGEIIADMIQRRRERRLRDGQYLETYLAFDPRPKMQFAPYVAFAESILEK